MRRILIALLLTGAIARCGEGLVDSNGVVVTAPDAGCDDAGGVYYSDGGCGPDGGDDHSGRDR